MDPLFQFLIKHSINQTVALDGILALKRLRNNLKPAHVSIILRSYILIKYFGSCVCPMFLF